MSVAALDRFKNAPFRWTSGLPGELLELLELKTLRNEVEDSQAPEEHKEGFPDQQERSKWNEVESARGNHRYPGIQSKLRKASRARRQLCLSSTRKHFREAD